MAAFSLLCVNPVIGAIGWLVLPMLWRLLWKPGEPAILVFCVSFQWLQAFAPVFFANYEGKTLAQEFGGPELELAAWYSLASVVAITFGLYLAVSRRQVDVVNRELHLQSSKVRLDMVFWACLVAIPLNLAVVKLSGMSGGLRQQILAFSLIKWVPFFILAWSTLQHRRDSSLLLIISSIEIILGLTGFFSGFKEILFVLVVVVVGVVVGNRRIQFLPVALVSIALFVLAGFWQSVKVEYRKHLNQGTGQQVEMVGYAERVSYIADAATRLKVEDLVSGLESGFRRLGYIEYFAHCIQRTPAFFPYQNGRLWAEAFEHTVMPRVFFPEKQEVNASDRTRMYTGLRVAGKEQGTAISIGFHAESYIDFGFPWMLLPIAAVGFLFGKLYIYVTKSTHTLVAFGLLTAYFLRNFKLVESSNLIMVGGATVDAIALILLLRVAVPYFEQWIGLTGTSLGNKGARGRGNIAAPIVVSGRVYSAD
jgi:hypothetical protein